MKTRQSRWCSLLGVVLFTHTTNLKFYDKKGYILRLISEIKASQTVGPFLSRRVAHFRKTTLNVNIVRARCCFHVIARACEGFRRAQASEIIVNFLNRINNSGANEKEDMNVLMQKYRRKIIRLQRAIRR